MGLRILKRICLWAERKLMLLRTRCDASLCHRWQPAQPVGQRQVLHTVESCPKDDKGNLKCDNPAGQDPQWLRDHFAQACDH